MSPQQPSIRYTCPTCHSTRVSVCCTMPPMPVFCNVLWPSAHAATTAPRGQIRLGFCAVCGMLFNAAFDPALVSYTPAYENSLHWSPRFQAYATTLATNLVARYDLYGKDILEIGCGQGEFLRLLCRAGGNRGIGFDASYKALSGQEEDVLPMTFIQDNYSTAYGHDAVDFICCRQVLEHIPAPRPFVAMVCHVARRRPGAVIFLEVPNAFYTLREQGIWDIIYEHCSYFSAPSLIRLCHEASLAPLDVYPAFGEQFLCLEARVSERFPGRKTGLRSVIDTLTELVDAFAALYRDKVAFWEETLQRWYRLGREIALWGAGSKGVTFVNTVAGAARIRHVVDINPHKQGRYIAGTGQRVVAPACLQNARIDTLLVMNPLYQDEIQQRLAQLGLHPDVHVV